jgi:hypothetical protein
MKLWEQRTISTTIAQRSGFRTRPLVRRCRYEDERRRCRSKRSTYDVFGRFESSEAARISPRSSLEPRTEVVLVQ